jgi:quercetin dioxygenase-like cupin family protein
MRNALTAALDRTNLWLITRENAMLTRRGFVGCAVCGFAATGAAAQTPEVKRTILTEIDGPVDGYITISMRAEIEPGAALARHTHPGIEATFVIEGGAELEVEGRKTRRLGPGDAFQIPAKTPHSAKNGPARTIIASTYVVEKGKPLASPAPFHG